jgi:hypothetical protein
MYDCATRSGVLSAVHVARIKAAARIDLEKKIIPIMRRPVPNTTRRFRISGEVLGKDMSG